jgi:SAM-dependent methyltransferase
VPGMADQQAAINTFLATVRTEHLTGHATPERSYYPAISSLLNGLLSSLSPARRAITDPRGIEREFPDLGVIEVGSNVLVLPAEVKPPTVEIEDILGSAQALKYARTFGGGAVLVTNIREFAMGRIDQLTDALVEEDRVVLANSAALLETKLAVGTETAAAFVGMLDTACQVRGSLRDPEDLARLLAFHAGRMRDAVEATGNAKDLLEPIHAAMRDGLHIDIEPALLVPTVVQTLVYGLFASWLESDSSEDLDWMEMAYRLDVPVFADVVHAALRPQLIRECNLQRHLNATARVLNWVDRARFTAAFDGDAIQYFYEPFLAAFDPLLRDRLGVWYTPKEITQYQVVRVDQQIRKSLGTPAGLADPSVYVLDPACGTGTYLTSLIRFIYQTHLNNGEPRSVAATRAREAAVTRFIGFEILPAAFVICHLHLARVLAQIDAPPLGKDRLRVYLTNALTGWTEEDTPTGQTLFPELEAELRDAAVAKHHDPILAIIGNPPYEGYSTADNDEERALLTAWIAPLWPVWKIRKHRLNDLYVRFWRMAVNRIVAMTGRGVISFISNRKWLGGRSYPAMRETIVTDFQDVYVDDLHGGVDDRTYPGDQSIFTTAIASGITRATTIVTAVRTDVPSPDTIAQVRRRDLRGSAAGKRNMLTEFRGDHIDDGMTDLTVSRESRWRFVEDAAGDYPPLDDYLPFYVSGVQPVRDEAVLADDRAILKERMTAYFDASIPWQKIAERYPGFAVERARYNGPTVRSKLLASSGFREARLVRFLYPDFRRS